MGKNILIISGWFCGCLLTIFVCFTTLNFLRKTQVLSYSGRIPSLNLSNNVIQILKTGSVPGSSSSIQSADARPIIIAEFLEKHQSPLQPYDYWGKFLTDLADQFDMDYRLLPSIAMQESNLCKKIPADSFNCLGLGIHSKGTWEFPSYESNFTKAAEVLKKNYLDQGLITPDEIQDKYTPGSNGSWEFAVNKFMDKLETADF